MNERYLGLMYPKVNILLKWESNRTPMSNTLKQFEQRIEQLATQFPDDPWEAMEILMRGMLEETLAKHRQT